MVVFVAAGDCESGDYSVSGGDYIDCEIGKFRNWVIENQKPDRTVLVVLQLPNYSITKLPNFFNVAFSSIFGVRNHLRRRSSEPARPAASDQQRAVPGRRHGLVG